MWEIEIRHEGLNKYRYIKGVDKYIVEQKALAQRLAWEELWQKKLINEYNKQAKIDSARNKDEKKELAALRTFEANNLIGKLQNILIFSLSVQHEFSWRDLIDNSSYSEPKPEISKYKEIPLPPDLSDAEFKPKLNLLHRIFKGLREEKIKAADKKFERAYGFWVLEKSKIEKQNLEIQSENSKMMKDWETGKQLFDSQREVINNSYLEKEEAYLANDSEMLLEYCGIVLLNSEYPEFFPKEWDLEYVEESKTLIVDYELPSLEILPNLKSVKYVASTDSFVETFYTKGYLEKVYDNMCYQISLRTMYELYDADRVDGIDNIVFNGWVDSIDIATGVNNNSCIMSLSALKERFGDVVLDKVEPRACFLQLKGVSASKLYGLTPILPLQSISREDRRFVSHYDVIENIQEGDNLAAMDWQDFENLIREIFAKEYSSNGGEVRITQASRDGGVDAIAFDPDPIKGGKVVIQAKRYTNVVGVSAVRDLYGTTLSEGATKGILVTTATYGNDAYEFAKGKPLTLLNGSNLLHLLSKHGHRARIDLKEAKLILDDIKKRSY